MSRLSVANEARTSIKSSDGKGITISFEVADIEQTRNELMEVGLCRHQSRMYGERRQSMSMIPKEIDLSFAQDGQRSSNVQTSYSMKLENEESAMLGILTTSHLKNTFRHCPACFRQGNDGTEVFLRQVVVIWLSSEKATFITDAVIG